MFYGIVQELTAPTRDASGGLSRQSPQYRQGRLYFRCSERMNDMQYQVP